MGNEFVINLFPGVGLTEPAIPHQPDTSRFIGGTGLVKTCTQVSTYQESELYPHQPKLFGVSLVGKQSGLPSGVSGLDPLVLSNGGSSDVYESRR